MAWDREYRTKPLSNLLICVIFFIAIAISGCSDDSSSVNTVCFSFDERQCNGDPWLADISPTSISDEQKLTELRSYLSGLSITLRDAQLDVNEDFITCQACFVCATGSTYLIEVDTALALEIESLELLNLQEAPCRQ